MASTFKPRHKINTVTKKIQAEPWYTIQRRARGAWLHQAPAPPTQAERAVSRLVAEQVYRLTGTVANMGTRVTWGDSK